MLQSSKKISFCIPCKDRIEFLKQTLPVNLRHNRRDRNDVEFVLVDFASQDGMSDWVVENFRSDLDTGLLNLFYTEQMPAFHMALAKNTAHVFAQGKILTNLDADNFTGPRGGRYVYRTFEKNNFNILLHQFSGTWRDGTCGRVSCLREHFWGVGGYNQRFHPCHDDLDFISRVCAKYSIKKVSGVSNRIEKYLFQRFFKTRSHPRYNRALPSPPIEPPETWKKLNEQFLIESQQNIADGNFVANGGECGIATDVLKYVDGQFVECMTTCSQSC